MNVNTITSRAQEFARIAHEGQIETTVTGVVRPKIVHIQEVADLVWASGGTDEEITAAWLHDSVEDTDVTIDKIRESFGSEVAEIVHGLTDLDDYKDLPIAERKPKQAERIRTENVHIRRIKMADQTSNVRFLAVDPTDSMTFEECGQYIKGAKMITDECRNISPLLDNLFDQAYETASLRYLSK
jgi:(p)ppGpp synthase/HD superfamily hydrolase